MRKKPVPGQQTSSVGGGGADDVAADVASLAVSKTADDAKSFVTQASVNSKVGGLFGGAGGRSKTSATDGKSTKASGSKDSLGSSEDKKKGSQSIMTSISKAEVYVEEKDYKLALLQTKLMTEFVNWRSFAMKGRLARYEKFLQKLRDPVDGIKFNNQNGLFNAQPLCATGTTCLQFLTRRTTGRNRHWVVVHQRHGR